MADIDPRWTGGPALSPEQCRDGRMLARWSIADLAGRAGVDPLTIQRFEAGEPVGVGGVALLDAFTVHGLQLIHDGLCGPDHPRWFLEGAPFNRSTDLEPHIGTAFRHGFLERGERWPVADALSWPREPDLPDELFERPVPVPYWATDTRVSHAEGEETRPAPGPPSAYLNGIEAEWVRRNPDALDRWPLVRAAMEMRGTEPTLKSSI